jgi:hypothetical protein
MLLYLFVLYTVDYEKRNLELIQEDSKRVFPQNQTFDIAKYRILRVQKNLPHRSCWNFSYILVPYRLSFLPLQSLAIWFNFSFNDVRISSSAITYREQGRESR